LQKQCNLLIDFSGFSTNTAPVSSETLKQADMDLRV